MTEDIKHRTFIDAVNDRPVHIIPQHVTAISDYRHSGTAGFEPPVSIIHLTGGSKIRVEGTPTDTLNKLQENQ